MAWNVPADDLAPDAEPCQPIAELAGGLAREGDGEGVLGVDVRVPGLPGDATGQDARLARAGAGEDRQRNGARGDGLSLRVIEALEQRVLEQLVFGHSWTIPTRYDSNRGPSADLERRKWERPRVVFAASQLRSPRGLAVRPTASGAPRRAGCPLRLRPGPWRRITPTFGHRPTPRTRIPAAANLTSPVPCPCHRCKRTYDRVRAPSRASRPRVRSFDARVARPLRGARRGRARLHSARPGRAHGQRGGSRRGLADAASSSAAAPARSSGCTRACSSPTGRRSTTRA